MTRSRRHLVVALALVAALAAGAACGGGTQSEPERLGTDAVPFNLLDPPTSTVPPTTQPAKEFAFVVYFMLSNTPVPVVRTASERPEPDVMGAALVAGPTREEARVGMSSSIPRRAIGRFGGVSNRVVTIDLNQPFVDVSGPAQTRALTQIVLTMTSRRGVNRVRFLLDGEPVSVPRRNGTVTDAPVSRADYLPAD
jgi:spore germination protein GerM